MAIREEMVPLARMADQPDMTVQDPWRMVMGSLADLWGPVADADHQFRGLLWALRRSHGPVSLCIDGREYHRRQRRRTKRNRR